MAGPYRTVATFLLLTTASLFLPANCDTCSSQIFTGNKRYTFCNDLPYLNSYLHWSFNPSLSSLSIAFIAQPDSPSGWISWAINPTGTGMVGSQALIAFKDSKGEMTVKTYNVSSYGPLKESKVWYEVKESSAEYSEGSMRLFATVVLPEKGKAAVNHVWQVGAAVIGGVPGKHKFEIGNMRAKGRLDLLKGQRQSNGDSDSKSRNRNIHGIINVISWGILFPSGIIFARYVKVFPWADPAWFYLHVSCQVSAYAIGVAGWATGIKLATESKGITYSLHRNIGIALFSLATIQILALFLRPNKEHKYRFYWNIYHHSLGYSIVILGIINVFKGFAILNPDQKWIHAYTIFISALGVIAALLEIITWCIVVSRNKSKSSPPAV